MKKILITLLSVLLITGCSNSNNKQLKDLSDYTSYDHLVENFGEVKDIKEKKNTITYVFDDVTVVTSKVEEQYVKSITVTSTNISLDTGIKLGDASSLITGNYSKVFEESYMNDGFENISGYVRVKDNSKQKISFSFEAQKITKIIVETRL